MTLSIIICTKNREKDFFDCLRCIKKQTQLPQTCIVIEDVSDQKYVSLQKLNDFFNSKKITCQYFETEANSPAVSRNVGLKNVKTDLLLFLDDDLLFGKDTLKKFLTLHKKHPKAAGFVGKILPIEKNTFSEFESWFFCRENLSLKKLSRVLSYPTAAISFRKGTLLRNKLQFNEEFQTGEDIDFLLRLNQKEEAIFFEPSIVLLHKFPTSIGQLCQKHVRYARSFALLAKKYPKQFFINEYFPTRKKEWSLFPIFILHQADSFAKKLIATKQISRQAYWPAFFAECCNFMGVYSSQEGQRLGKTIFLKVWLK